MTTHRTPILAHTANDKEKDKGKDNTNGLVKSFTYISCPKSNCSLTKISTIVEVSWGVGGLVYYKFKKGLKTTPKRAQ